MTHHNLHNETSSDNFKDVHKLKLLTNSDVNLTSSSGGVTNLTVTHYSLLLEIRSEWHQNLSKASVYL